MLDSNWNCVDLSVDKNKYTFFVFIKLCSGLFIIAFINRQFFSFTVIVLAIFKVEIVKV